MHEHTHTRIMFMYNLRNICTCVVMVLFDETRVMMIYTDYTAMNAHIKNNCTRRIYTRVQA